MILVSLALLVSSLVMTIRAFRRTSAGALTTAVARGELVAALLSLGASIAASGALLVLPMYSTVEDTAMVSSNGETVRRSFESKQTILQVNSPRALVPLALPIVFAAIPILLRKSDSRLGLEGFSATALAAFTIISGFSIGLFYLSSAGAMLVAAMLGGRHRNLARSG